MSNIAKGSLYALGAFFFMAVFGILTRLALESASIYWVSFIAYLVGVLFLVPYVAKQGISFLRSDHYPLLIGRALFGTLASFLYSFSLNYIPIVNGTLLFNTAPLFIPLLSLVFLKTKIEKMIWFAVLIGFIGIIIIIKPTEAIFTQTGNLLAVASGISLAVAYLMMKILTNTDSPVRIIFYYLGLGMVLQIPLVAFAGSLPSHEGVLYSALSGISLLIAQLLLVTAYKYAGASEVGVYQYSSVVFVGLFEWLLWNIAPSLSTLLGFLLVAFAGITVIRSNPKEN